MNNSINIAYDSWIKIGLIFSKNFRHLNYKGNTQKQQKMNARVKKSEEC